MCFELPSPERMKQLARDGGLPLRHVQNVYHALASLSGLAAKVKASPCFLCGKPFAHGVFWALGPLDILALTPVTRAPERFPPGLVILQLEAGANNFEIAHDMEAEAPTDGARSVLVLCQIKTLELLMKQKDYSVSKLKRPLETFTREERRGFFECLMTLKDARPPAYLPAATVFSLCREHAARDDAKIIETVRTKLLTVSNN